MTDRTTVALLMLLAVVMAPVSALAGWPDLSRPSDVKKTGAGDVAVIVAVDEYLLLPDVSGAVENANDWEVFLRQGLGVETVHVLSNQDVTRESMLKFARMAASDVSSDGRIWWVFIGHGAPHPSGEDGLLVGMDAQQTIESLQARSIRRSELLGALGDGKAVVVIDACFSGTTADGEALAAGVQPVVAVDALKSTSGKVVLSAARPNEVAGRLPGARRPAFSYLVLGAMRGWADDGDGSVTAGEAVFFARRELRGVKGRQQTPQIDGNSSDVLTEGATEPKPDVDPREMVEEDDPSEPEESAGDGRSKAELKLRYMAERVTYDGRQFRQNGQVLDGVSLYNALGKPELGEEFRTHTPWMWGLGGVFLAGGIAAVVWGLSGEESARTLGGFLGGFFTFAAGVSLLTIGIMLDDHPVSRSEREAMAREHNAELREKYGLGPEDDDPVQTRSSSPFFGSSSWNSTSQIGIGISLSF